MLGTSGPRYQERYWHSAQFEAVEKLRKVAEPRGLDIVSVSVAWVLAQEGITSAIIGASRPEQLAASLAAPGVEFDGELREVCDELWWGLPRRPVHEGYR